MQGNISASRGWHTKVFSFLHLSDTEAWGEFGDFFLPNRLVDYFLVWQENGIYHHLGKFWSQAVKLNKIFISRNRVWETCVSPLVKGGCEVERKQGWGAAAFVTLSCVVSCSAVAARMERIPAAMPKAKSLWEQVMELQDSNQVSTPWS